MEEGCSIASLFWKDWYFLHLRFDARRYLYRLVSKSIGLSHAQKGAYFSVSTFCVTFSCSWYRTNCFFVSIHDLLLRKLNFCDWRSGGTRGIGLEIGKALARRGANVVVGGKTFVKSSHCSLWLTLRGHKAQKNMKRYEIHGSKKACRAKLRYACLKQLQGTIHTAAKELCELGGQAIGVYLDVRDPESIINAVKKAVDAFGGIDILVNCVSATCLLLNIASWLLNNGLLHRLVQLNLDQQINLA